MGIINIVEKISSPIVCIPIGSSWIGGISGVTTNGPRKAIYQYMNNKKVNFVFNGPFTQGFDFLSPLNMSVGGSSISSLRNSFGTWLNQMYPTSVLITDNILLLFYAAENIDAENPSSPATILALQNNLIDILNALWDRCPNARIIFFTSSSHCIDTGGTPNSLLPWGTFLSPYDAAISGVCYQQNLFRPNQLSYNDFQNKQYNINLDNLHLNLTGFDNAGYDIGVNTYKYLSSSQALTGYQFPFPIWSGVNTNNSSGITAFYDFEGNLNNSINSGLTTCSINIGTPQYAHNSVYTGQQAIIFNGTQYLNFSGSIVNLPSGTVEFSCKIPPNANALAQQIILLKGTNSANNTLAIIDFFGTTFIRINDVDHNVGAQLLPYNQYYIAITWDQNSSKFYSAPINSGLIGTSTLLFSGSTPNWGNFDKAWMGSESNGNNKSYCIYDSVKFSNTVRTSFPTT